MSKESYSTESKVKKVLYITFFLNIFVAAIKLIAGHQFNYLSLTSSGLESLFDGSANILALISIIFAYKPADKDHPFGHYKFETLGSFIIAGLLLFSAYQVLSGLHMFSDTEIYIKPNFGIVPLLSIIISMGVSLFVSIYEKKKANELGSNILMADAEHTMGDFVISFGVLISIICSYFGIMQPDFYIGIVIGVYLIFLAIKIIKSNLPDLLDSSPAIKLELVKSIEELPKVRNVHKFRARGNQHFMHIDFHLLLDPSLSLIEAHEVGHESEDVLRELLKDYCQNVDILVHVEPFMDDHNLLLGRAHD